MRPPVDYPISNIFNPTSQEQASQVTYAMLLEHHDKKGVITAQMIKKAEANLAAADQVPTANKPIYVTQNESTDIIDRIRQVIK